MRRHAFTRLAAWEILGACFLILGGCAKTPKEIAQARLAWNLQTTLEAYKHAGHTNAAWDASATAALTAFAQLLSHPQTAEASREIIATEVNSALAAGCDDPLINYLHVRYGMDNDSTQEAYAEGFIKAARDLNGSAYPAVRKFYAAARTCEQVYATYRQKSIRQPLYNEFYPMMEGNLDATLRDKTMPAAEAYEAANLALSLARSDTKYYQAIYDRVKKPLFHNWPDDATTYLFKGNVAIKFAWDARGGGYADKVTPQRWEGFKNGLAEAETALNKAWKLDPNDARIAIDMIRVDEGLEKSRDDMELWFSRAMIADPNSYNACQAKLHYLSPQWYGSREAMVAFGKECVESEKWGGEVPLILADAHYQFWIFLDNSEVKTNYWKYPDVWPDVSASFEKFFQLNPESSGYYHNYAWYAYKCEQWDKLNELIPKLGPVNYAYFGGKEAYDQMARDAKLHAKKLK